MAKKRERMPIALLILHVPSGPEGSCCVNLAAEEGTAAARNLAGNFSRKVSAARIDCNPSGFVPKLQK
jgi:hypothetical protein